MYKQSKFHYFKICLYSFVLFSECAENFFTTKVLILSTPFLTAGRFTTKDSESKEDSSFWTEKSGGGTLSISLCLYLTVCLLVVELCFHAAILSVCQSRFLLESWFCRLDWLLISLFCLFIFLSAQWSLSRHFLIFLKLNYFICLLTCLSP